MRKYSVLFIVVLVGALLAACNIQGSTVVGSGNIVEHKVEAAGFDRVEAGGAFQVSIRQSESYSVVVRIDDNLVRCLDAYVSGGKLTLGIRSECWIANVTRMEADITMPALTGLELSGASRGTITGFDSSKDLGVEVSGASSLEGDIASGNVTINASGASSVTLTGSGGNLTADVSGASHVDLGSFPVQNALVQVSGASSATVHPSGRIDADASGASHVYYLGEPTLGTMNTSGGSSIQRK
jgi:predicted small secreted protein